MRLPLNDHIGQRGLGKDIIRGIQDLIQNLLLFFAFFESGQVVTGV
jgi:hypothetical protein